MRMLYALCCLIALSFPALADDADLKKQVGQLTASYLESWNKQDATGLVALWAPDAIYDSAALGPNKPSQDTYEKMFKAGLQHLESTVTQVLPMGPDAAVGTGTYHFTGKSPSGAAIDTEGYFTAAYVKEGGKWKLKMLMGAPKPPPAK